MNTQKMAGVLGGIIGAIVFVAAFAQSLKNNGIVAPKQVAKIEAAKAPVVGIAPGSVELYEAVVAVNDVKRPSQFGQERDCWSPFRSERQARPPGQEVACRL